MSVFKLAYFSLSGHLLTCHSESRSRLHTPNEIRGRWYNPMVAVLLKAIADISRTNEQATTKEGLTALHVDSKWSHKNVVNLLLEVGGNVLTVANNREMSLHLSERRYSLWWVILEKRECSIRRYPIKMIYIYIHWNSRFTTLKYSVSRRVMLRKVVPPFLFFSRIKSLLWLL